MAFRKIIDYRLDKDDHIIYGTVAEKNNEYEVPLFNEIVISHIFVDKATSEQTARIVMTIGDTKSSADMQLANLTGKAVMKEFRKYGFQCVSSVAEYLEEWLINYSMDDAVVTTGYHKSGFITLKDEGKKQFCYPGVVEDEYLGEKDIVPTGSHDDAIHLLESLYKENKNIGLLLATGLSAPVVARLRPHTGTENLLVSLSGPTSTGKTTSLKLMASLWGNPKLGQEGLLDNLNTTTNALYSKLSGINGFPVFLDETISNASINWQQMCYELADGLSKARADTNGNAKKQASWNTTIILTSEGTIMPHLKTDGSKSRLIELPISFFNRKKTVEHVKSFVSMNYGHVAGKFITKLSGITDEKLFEMYNESSAKISETFKGTSGPEYGRLLDRIALIDVTAKVLMGMDEFKYLNTDDLYLTYDEVTKNIKQVMASSDDDMLEILTNKVEANINHFVCNNFPKVKFNEQWSTGATYGKIDYVNGTYTAYIMTDIAHSWLGLQNAEAKQVFARWKRKGLLSCTDHNRTKYRISLNGRKVYTYAINLESAGVDNATLNTHKNMFRKKINQPSLFTEIVGDDNSTILDEAEAI